MWNQSRIIGTHCQSSSNELYCNLKMTRCHAISFRAYASFLHLSLRELHLKYENKRRKKRISKIRLNPISFYSNEGLRPTNRRLEWQLLSKRMPGLKALADCERLLSQCSLLAAPRKLPGNDKYLQRLNSSFCQEFNIILTIISMRLLWLLEITSALSIAYRQ